MSERREKIYEGLTYIDFNGVVEVQRHWDSGDLVRVTLTGEDEVRGLVKLVREQSEEIAALKEMFRAERDAARREGIEAAAKAGEGIIAHYSLAAAKEFADAIRALLMEDAR